MHRIIFFFLLLILAIWPENDSRLLASLSANDSADPIGCLACHGEIAARSNHRFHCSLCHRGKAEALDKKTAHEDLIAKPGHPNHMEAACGQCHPKQTSTAKHSSHFTLSREINATRQHFGATKSLSSPQQIPIEPTLSHPIALVDDMLRRRCLRCHVYNAGDAYSSVRRGTGCSACHLSFKDGKLSAHRFHKPLDQNCLSCHYGNFVGGDYYGRYEQDYPAEYRSPFTSNGDSPPRPYGVEYHQLAPDTHQERGLSCLDCHQGFVHRLQAARPSCSGCHGWKPGKNLPPLTNLRQQGQRLELTAVVTGTKHSVPSLRHPAHQRYQAQVACQVCHAQWGFRDASTHLLLSFSEDFEAWQWLQVQSSSEVESFLHQALESFQGDTKPHMLDALSGEQRPGLWLQGYGERRWESLLIAKDEQDGVIKVFRPILDLRLSMIDAKGQPVFDALRGKNSGLRPYSPHTIGPAGLFYRDRFSSPPP